jgi:hypothetical protein
MQESQLAKPVDDLGQVALGSVAALGDLGLGDKPTGIDGAEHQQPDGDIGSLGDPHGRRSCLQPPNFGPILRTGLDTSQVKDGNLGSGCIFLRLWQPGEPRHA